MALRVTDITRLPAAGRLRPVVLDWTHQLRTSLIWLGEAFAISVIGLALTGMGLATFTAWGRQVRRITAEYFAPSRSLRPLAWLALLVVVTLFSVRLNILLSFWNNGFYSAMQKLDGKAFWFLLLVFATLATIYVARALLSFYLRQAFLIHWRTWLTNALLERWLRQQSYYRSQFAPVRVDNPDQRIQQDVESFVDGSLTLSLGLLDAVVSLFSFTLILWGLSGTLAMFGVEIPRAMVFLVYLYVIVSTIVAVRIGRPLVRLSFLNEALNASFRYALIRLREYGESIAFYRGEGVERDGLLARFGALIRNMWGILFCTLKFQGFNLAVSQAAVVDMTDALGRLDNKSVRECDGGRVALAALTVRGPTGQLVVKDLTLDLPPASSLIIRGRSGIGKTTLLRAIAGLWPYVEGRIVRPADAQSLFLPQKPYLPLGTLRSCLYYPRPPAEREDPPAALVLQRCQLGHLVDRLDDEEDWSRILSLGEQQHLAIGRVLLNRPAVVFLDESSSGLDEGLEHAMYRLLRESLPEATLVSVGHRRSLLTLHTWALELQAEGRWTLRPIPDRDHHRGVEWQSR
jgi:putative ATP-binding cassette transporter